jgi:hypothetical protein
MEQGTTTTNTLSGSLMAKAASLVVSFFFITILSTLLITSKPIFFRLSGANIAVFCLILLFILVSFGFSYAMFHFSQGTPSWFEEIPRFSGFFIGATIFLILIQLAMKKIPPMSVTYSIFITLMFTFLTGSGVLFLLSFLYNSVPADKTAFFKSMDDQKNLLILTFYFAFFPFFLYYNPFQLATKYFYQLVAFTIIGSSILFGAIYIDSNKDTSVTTSVTTTEPGSYELSKQALGSVNVIVFGAIVSSIVIYALYKGVSWIGKKFGGALGFFPRLIEIGVIICALGLVYKALSSGDYFRRLPPLIRLIIYVILYIPCLLTLAIDGTMNLLAPGPNRTNMILIIMIVLFLVFYFTEPLLEQAILLQKARLLINDPVPLNKQVTLATYDELNGANPKSDKTRTPAAVSSNNRFWGTIPSMQPSLQGSGSGSALDDYKKGVISTTTKPPKQINYGTLLFGDSNENNDTSGLGEMMSPAKETSSSGQDDFLLNEINNMNASMSGALSELGSQSGSYSGASSSALAGSSDSVSGNTPFLDSSSDYLSTDPSSSYYYKKDKKNQDNTNKKLEEILTLSNTNDLFGIGKGAYVPNKTSSSSDSGSNSFIAANITPGTTISGSTIYKPANNFSYQYGISFWIYLEANPPNTNASHSRYVSLLNYGGKPDVLYRASTNTLQVIVHNPKSINGISVSGISVSGISDSGTSAPHDQVIFEKKKVPLQQWIHIVINYVGGTMDVFWNNELAGTANNVAPYMKYDNLTSGTNQGIEGGIGNVTYYNKPLSLFRIATIYEGSRGKPSPALRTTI